MFKNSAPTILIANGANLLGLKLTEILLDQGSNVIMVDEFDESKIHFARHFKKNKNFLFLEEESFDVNKEKIQRLDYTFLLLYEKNIGKENISTKNFIHSTKLIDSVFELSQYKKSKTILVTSIHAHKKLVNGINDDNKAYTYVDVQKYAERIAAEYIEELDLNNRIVRIGTLFGPEMELDENNIVVKMSKEAIVNDYISIFGDGLEYDHYVYSMDAVYGLIKAIFDEKTKGKIYSLSSTDHISKLTLGNMILKCDVKASGLKFIKERDTNDPLVEHTYVPPNNLTEIGWSPAVDIKEALKNTVEYIREEMGVEKVVKTQKVPASYHISQVGDLKIEDEEPIVIQVKRKKTTSKPQYTVKNNFGNKYKLFIYVLIIVIFMTVFFTAILPITNAISVSSEQTKILMEINNSVVSEKDSSKTKKGIDKITETDGIDKLESRIKSLEPLLNITGQKSSYNTYIKSFAAYQYYISALQKVTAITSINSVVYANGTFNASDVYTVQSINQIKSELNESMNALKGVSLEALPSDTKKELERMNEISKSIVEKLTF